MKFVMKRWIARHWRWFPLFAVSFVGGWQLWKAFLTNWVFWLGARTDADSLGEISHLKVTGAIVSALFAGSTSMVVAIREEGTGAKKSPDLCTYFSWLTAVGSYFVGSAGWWMNFSIKEKASISTWFIALALGLIIAALSASRIKTAKLIGRGVGLASVMMVGWQAMQWFRDGMTGYAVLAIMCALQWVISLRLLEGPMRYIRSILRQAKVHVDVLRDRSIVVDQADLNRRKRKLRVNRSARRIAEDHDADIDVDGESSFEAARMYR